MKKLSLEKKQNFTGWAMIIPAALLIAVFSFYPMIQAFIQSLQTGRLSEMEFAGLYNYQRLFRDRVFMQSLRNTVLYLIIQVPIMQFLALILATQLNRKDLKFKGLLRTLIFLPSATSLVSYSIIFKSMFAVDGFINEFLVNLGFIEYPLNWLGTPHLAKFVIIIALIWRWTGYNMIFFLAGLQNIEPSIYEAARIDGASSWKQLTKITIPLLRPIILLNFITSTNGTLQLFDESMNLTGGGPANATITMSHYIYDTAFSYNPNFGYVSALSVFVLVLVAIPSLMQLRVGDSRD